jgi:molecular chaperone DnaJ
VVVRVKDHTLFHRDGDNLVVELPVSFTQAALGAEVDVPTIDGRQQLRIHAGAQHGDVYKLDGQGLPNLRSGRHGDLITIVKIEIPKKLTARQQELLREFAETEDQSVLPESHGFWKKMKDLFGA